MIIGIDVSQIVYNTGVSRYTRELVRHLLQIDTENVYKLYAGALRQTLEIQTYFKDLRSSGLCFSEYLFPIPPKIADKFWNDWRFIDIESVIGPIDLFHSSNWTQPRTKAKKVTTVHDLTPALYPNYHDSLVIQNFKKNIQLIESQADLVFVDSKATEEDLVEHSSIPRQKIEVVYPGLNAKFRASSYEEITRVKQKYHLQKPYILTVGTKEPRKNIQRLIEAFESLNNGEINLVLVGKHGWGKDDMKVGDKKLNIIELGFVADEELPALYSGAMLFAYPSLYEGFGFPVLEAMACGCPVITSNISSLPEIAGNAALLVYPKDVKEIAHALHTLISNRNLQRDLTKKGLIQAKKFSWEEAAKQTLKIYNIINEKN